MTVSPIFMPLSYTVILVPGSALPCSVGVVSSVLPPLLTLPVTGQVGGREALRSVLGDAESLVLRIDPSVLLILKVHA